MGRMITRPGSDAAGAAPECRALRIGGKSIRNSAAKFWGALVGEVLADFAECTEVELEATGAGALDADDLDPHRSLQRDAERWQGRDLEAMLAETAAELDLLGPPGAVQVRLLAGTTVLFEDALPLDMVDGEIYVYLLAWILKWAGIDAARWNDEFVQGDFEAEPLPGGSAFRLALSLRNRPLAEGLVRRTLYLTAAPCGRADT
jgi:hypothetical protein